MKESERIIRLGHPAAQPPALSVVIPSYNRADSLLNTLETLAKQEADGFEVIVVIDGSADGSFERCAALTPPWPLTVIWHTNQGRSDTRNRGAAAAQAPLLLFIDDDLLLEADVVSRHLAFHEAGSGRALVGQVPLRGSVPETDVQQFRRWLEIGWTANLPKCLGPMPDSVTYLTAAHFSIQKDLFYAMNGFELGLNWGEDRQFAARLKSAGVPIWYDQQAVAWHHDPMNFRRLALRLRKESDDSSPALAPKPALNRWKSLILRPFANEIWVRRIDEGAFWLKLAPRSLRWFVYRLVLAALSYHYKNVDLELAPKSE